MRPIDADECREKLYAIMPEFDEEDDKKCIEGQTIFFCISVLDDMPTITPPPNVPLTLEELREMDGEPVWVEYPGRWGEWQLVKISPCGTVYLWTSKGYATFAVAAFADEAIVYRRKTNGGNDMLIDLWKEPCELAEDWKKMNTEELIKIAREIKDMRNEICFACGKYKDAHLGVCDGCRWEGVEE